MSSGRGFAAMAMTSALVLGVGIATVPSAGAAAKPGACELVTTDELGAALGSTVQPGSADDIGTGITCGYDAIGPVRGATVRLARGREAKLAMKRTLKALRETLRSVDSAPPRKVAGLGDSAYYSLDEFLGEGSIEVLDGRTFVQVTAIVAPDGDPALVSEAVLSGLAQQALAAAT